MGLKPDEDLKENKMIFFNPNANILLPFAPERSIFGAENHGNLMKP